MDKRQLRSKGSLHRHLIGSQLSSRSESSSQTRSLNNETLTRKRKLPSFSIERNESDDDIGAPLAESTILKKRRDESVYTQGSQRIVQDISKKNITQTPEKSLSGRTKSFAGTQGTSLRLRHKEDIGISNKSLRTFSPEKSSVAETQCRFTEFLRKSEIILNADGPHVLCKDLIKVQQKMKELLVSGQYRKQEIIDLLEKFIENEQNLKNALNDMEISINGENPNTLRSCSLVRILLQVPELHPEIYNILFSKLNEAVLIADSMDAVPWTGTLLQQFRFLDVVSGADALIINLENLLESCPSWFQTELLLFLPDIVTDKHHQAIAEILNKFMEENSELTNLVLNCMSSLDLGKEYMNEYREKVLNLLKTNLKMTAIPAAIKFVLEDCTNPEVLKKTLTVLRSVDIQPLAGERLEDCYKNQMEIMNILKVSILLTKETVNVTIGVIKSITKDPKPLDIILLLIVFSTTPTRKKKIETIMKQRVRSGFYRQSLLTLLYNDFQKVVQELQPSALQLSSIFLKTDERVFTDFAIDWFRLQFLSHRDKVFKQREILEKIILLMGSNDQTAKNALSFLRKMVSKEEERQCLESHCNHIRILIEKMDTFGLEEVGILGDLLHNLCMNSNSVSESLRDDLYILLQKQLSAIKPITKCKGALGAVMAIKHSMVRSDTSNAAYNLFHSVLTKVKNCPRSQALFYDELAKVIAHTQNIDITFLQKLANHIEEEFINTYMVDRTSYSGELVSKFGLNNVDNEPENCCLNFENKKYGAIVPISFKLLRTCCVRLSENGDLDAIDALLGCAILMPESFDIPEHSVLDLVICCINWFREVINGFVTQTDVLLQKQVLQRLDNLIHLQGELASLLSLCDTKYQPPPCYFQYFPLPPFVRTEKKVKKQGKKGKKGSAEKTVNLSEIDSWELGSTLSSKNPAYFRKLEPKIAHLLDVKMELHTSQCAAYSISLQQVCFVVKELLGLFEQESNETFVRDIIDLLPKILTKLQDIADSLREENNTQGREAVKLLLCLLTKIFNWKGFESVTYNPLLRGGLRTLAGQINEANVMLRSCKELVAESYKYFESLSDIATQISLAIALINMCQALMKHSETYTKQNKEKHAKIAFSFLCLQWPEDKYYTPMYKLAVTGLLNNWLDNEPLPLKTITIVLEWLPEEASKLEKPQDCLSRIPSVRRNNFHSLYKKLFDGLIKGVKIALPLANTDPERIDVWYEVASNVQKLIQISKTLKMKNSILIFLRYMPILLRIFLNLGMPILEHNLKYQVEDVTKIVKMIQGSTRYLHAICCDSTEKKDMSLAKHVPAAKSVLERLVYSVKGMLVLNNSPAAFWMGNLVNKNLDGAEILSQNLSSEESTIPNSDLITDDVTNISSEILDSDSDDDLVNEGDESS